jgi:FG-GAP-like repeat
VVDDFNGDGKVDIAVANYTDNTVTIALSNGDGTFTQAAARRFLWAPRLTP